MSQMNQAGEERYKIYKYMHDLNSRVAKINMEADKFTGKGEQVVPKTFLNQNSTPDQLRKNFFKKLIFCLSKGIPNQRVCFFM